MDTAEEKKRGREGKKALDAWVEGREEELQRRGLVVLLLDDDDDGGGGGGVQRMRGGT